MNGNVAFRASYTSAFTGERPARMSPTRTGSHAGKERGGAHSPLATSGTAAAHSLLRPRGEKKPMVAVDEFAATIAHEIRTPLSTIALALDYLNAERQTVKAQQRLTLAISEAQRLERMLSELLLFTKPYQLHRCLLNLNEVVSDTLDNLRDSPVTQRRDIRFQTTDQSIVVDADNDKLKQVLINLLVNACQATEPHDIITINTFETCSYDAIVIEITNPGEISADVIDRITEPFFSTKPQGSGLGLPIVKRIVEAHAGSFSIRSDDHLGVVARVFLPSR